MISEFIEACGFNHGFGGLEGTSRIGQISYGEDGKEYYASDRIAKKIATFGAVGVSAYVMAKYGMSL